MGNQELACSRFARGRRIFFAQTFLRVISNAETLLLIVDHGAPDRQSGARGFQSRSRPSDFYLRKRFTQRRIQNQIAGQIAFDPQLNARAFGNPLHFTGFESELGKSRDRTPSEGSVVHSAPRFRFGFFIKYFLEKTISPSLKSTESINGLILRRKMIYEWDEGARDQLGPRAQRCPFRPWLYFSEFKFRHSIRSIRYHWKCDRTWEDCDLRAMNLDSH